MRGLAVGERLEEGLVGVQQERDDSHIALLPNPLDALQLLLTQSWNKGLAVVEVVNLLKPSKRQQNGSLARAARLRWAPTETPTRLWRATGLSLCGG